MLTEAMLITAAIGLIAYWLARDPKESLDIRQELYGKRRPMPERPSPPSTDEDDEDGKRQLAEFFEESFERDNPLNWYDDDSPGGGDLLNQ